MAYITHVLKTMDAVGVVPNTETYNLLFSVFPQKNTFVMHSIPDMTLTHFHHARHISFKTMSLFDAIWARDTPQSECVLQILERMEEENAIPEAATHEILLRVRFAFSLH